jgi:hypothetical protein
MTTRQLIDSTEAEARPRSRAHRAVDWVGSFCVYFILTALGFAFLGIVGRILFSFLKTGWYLAAKFFF